jgi:hypothetical protein
MDHLTLLSQLYLAYKNEDAELAYTLRDAYPEVFDEVAELIKRADTQEKFQELLEDLTK